LYQNDLVGKPRSVIITCGAGGLSAAGTHFFDLCSFLLESKVSSLHAIPIDKNLPNPRGKEFHDPGGYILLNFENESRAFIDMGDDLGLKPIIEIVGEYGRVIIDEPNKEITINGRSIEDRKQPKHLYVLPNPLIKKGPFAFETMDEMITAMMKNLLSESNVIVTPEMAKDKVEIYSAVRKSFDTKSIVNLPLLDEYFEKEYMVT